MGARKRGRRFRRGILKFVILKLLAESSRHGYDLMRVFAERGWSSGRPGSIYPILNALAEEGLVTSRAEGERRIYEITEKGQRHLNEHAAHAGNFFEQFFEGDDDEESAAPGPASGLRDAASRLMQAITQVGQSKPETIERVRELLDKTRKDVYTLLAQE
jgi:DNA-binding PadR family transcriptional regulator